MVIENSGLGYKQAAFAVKTYLALTDAFFSSHTFTYCTLVLTDPFDCLASKF